MWLRRVLIAALVLLVIGAAGMGGMGWYYAGEIEEGALAVDRSPETYDLTVKAVAEGSVTLAVTDDTDLEHGDWRQDGVWGLEWDGGYAQVGRIVELTDSEVVRSLTPLSGIPPTGQAARLDTFAFDGDPRSALGIPFDEVTFTSDGAELPAWRIAGSDDTWAILVHGKGSSREETLRMLPLVVDAGMPALAITYRNDEGAPASKTGFYDYGASEWRDLEAAVQYALGQGAKDVVLVGYSMGGGIVASFMYNSDAAGNVARIVLDSPMLAFADVIDYGAERRGLPGILTWAGKTVASVRYGLDWDGLDYLGRSDNLKVPVLLFHGDADRTVHIRTSERLAAANPDMVTYVHVAGATHVRSWNVDRPAYEAAVASFLEEVIE